MIIQSELFNLLQERLQGKLSEEGIYKLAAEILALNEGWEELDIKHLDMGYSMSANCPDMCWLGEQVYNGAVLKILRKKK